MSDGKNTHKQNHPDNEELQVTMTLSQEAKQWHHSALEFNSALMLTDYKTHTKKNININILINFKKCSSGRTATKLNVRRIQWLMLLFYKLVQNPSDNLSDCMMLSKKCLFLHKQHTILQSTVSHQHHEKQAAPILSSI